MKIKKLNKEVVHQYKMFNLDPDYISNINMLPQKIRSHVDRHWEYIPVKGNVDLLNALYKPLNDHDVEQKLIKTLKKDQILAHYQAFLDSKRDYEIAVEQDPAKEENSLQMYLQLVPMYWPIFIILAITGDPSEDGPDSTLIRDLPWRAQGSPLLAPIFVPDNWQEIFYLEEEIPDPEPIIPEENEDTEEDEDEVVPESAEGKEIQKFIGDIYEALTVLNERQESMEKEITSLQNNVTEHTNSLEDLLPKIEELIDKKLKSLSDEIAESAYSTKIKLLEQELEDTQTELSSRMEELADLRSEIDNSSVEVEDDGYSDKLLEKDREIAELREVLKRLNGEKNQLSTENQLLRSTVDSYKTDSIPSRPDNYIEDTESDNDVMNGYLNNTELGEVERRNIERLNKLMNFK